MLKLEQKDRLKWIIRIDDERKITVFILPEKPVAQ
jgi:hypothetical protein